MGSGRERVATAATGVATRLYDYAYGNGQDVTVVHHSYAADPPVVQDDVAEPVHHEVAFATEAQHDALPVYHGDAYHGTYHQGTNLARTNHYYTSSSSYGYGNSQSYATVSYGRNGSAGIWWIILFVTLLILAGVGIYYYCCRK